MILIVLLLIIILEAVYEALRDRGKKLPSGILEGLSHAIMLVGIISLQTSPIWYLIYILYRYAIFDFVYNSMVGKDPLYLGNTKLYDKALNWILDKIEKIKTGKDKKIMFPRWAVLFMSKILAMWSAAGLSIRYFSQFKF